MTGTGLWVFAGVLVLGQFSPGPDMLLVTRTALRHGTRDGLWLAFGIGCGLMVHATVAVTGMAVVFHQLPALRVALQWLAAAYLLWIARGLLVERFGNRRKHDSGNDAAPAHAHSPYVRGLLCNLLNVKAALFFAAVCTPFLGTEPTIDRALVIWLMIVGLGMGLWCLWVLLLQWPPVRRAYLGAAAWIDGFFALFLALLAVRLVIGG